jgi:isochorismate synthase
MPVGAPELEWAMTISAALRAYVAVAQQRGLPVAIWRRPGGDRFEGVVSLSPMTVQPVFADGRARAGFVLSRFGEPVAGDADMMIADVVISGDDVRFVVDGSALQETPASAEQAQLAEDVTGASASGPVQAGHGATPPAQTGKDAYAALIRNAVAAIEAGNFVKVVTSRAEARDLPVDYDLLVLAERLAARYPAAFVSLVVRPGQDAWLVATPETLMSLRDGMVRTMALAGTQAAPGDVDLRAVTWTDKFIEEQALVSHYIRRAFADCGIADYREAGPRTMRAANLVHLRSEFEADVSAATGARLLAALHPTAAVCGQPKAPATAFLRNHEGYDRSCYTGYLGPVDIDGGSDLYVNLRTSQIIGDKIYLYVGGGIVGDSDPEAEWQETVEKTKTIGAVLAAD